MFDHVPRLRNALFAILLGCTVLLGGASLDGRLPVWPMYTGGWLVVALGFLEACLLANGAMVILYDAMTSYGNMLAKLSPDQMGALGIAFPHLGLKFHGDPLLTIFDRAGYDTGVTIEAFQTFLDGSTSAQTMPERIWPGNREMYRRIIDWLETDGWVIPDSGIQAGPYSWRWKSLGNVAVLRSRYCRKSYPNWSQQPEQANA